MECKTPYLILLDSHQSFCARFRWVYCQLDYLSDCLPGRIRQALDELPATLDETYERTLGEIKDTNWEFAQRLLQCVAVVSRPLSVEELADFLAFDFKAGPIPKFREDWRMEDPLEAVLSTCSTLLALVNDDFDDPPVIQFSHFSIKEFLMSPRFAGKCGLISRRYHISMTSAHTLVAQACLGILLHLNENITKDDLTKFPIAEYAARRWVEHARFEGVSQNMEIGMQQLFDASKHHLAAWLWIHDPLQPGKRVEQAAGTPLHYAAFCGLDTVVGFLAVRHPQDVQSRGVHDGSTPLHLASSVGHVEVARVLVEHGADVTDRDEHGWTPLHEASEAGMVEVARILIEHGADVTAQNKDGSTPLHQALKSGNVDLARFLIEHGADTTAHDKDGLTPLHEASETGMVEFARILIEHGADVTAQDKNGSTPLHQASKSGNVDLARFLIGHGASATAQDKDGLTPLHWASYSWLGGVDVAKFLVEQGADVMAQNENGLAPLHKASQSGNVDLIRFLVENGASVTARDKEGWTPLHHASASWRGNVDIAQFLIEHGADVMAQDKNRLTPLHAALSKGTVDLAQFLVESGADVTARDKDGCTPLHYISVLWKENVDIARLLINHGADVTAKDRRGLTPLHHASLSGHVILAQLLVEHGADPTAQDKDGSTPLHQVSAWSQGTVDTARPSSITPTTRQPKTSIGRPHCMIHRVVEISI